MVTQLNSAIALRNSHYSPENYRNTNDPVNY